jgi:uncharacterized protein (DUF433 family)
MLQNINWKDYIIANPNILVGKPVIKGTRISVEFLLGLFSKGWTEKQIVEEYPGITRESLQAVFSYLEEYFKDEFHFHLPEKQKKDQKSLLRSTKTKATKKN